MSVEVGAPDVADEQRVPGEHEPRVVYPSVVRNQIRVVRGGVTGRGDRLDLGVAELQRLAVGERMVVELDPRAGRQVGGRTSPLDQLRQSRDVIGLQVRLEDGDDLRPLRLSAGDVLVDEVDVRIDDGERALGLAAEQIRGAGCLVVEELSEIHAGPPGGRSRGLTRYQEST